MLTKIYSDNPNRNEVNKVADILASGGVAIIPTDTLYSFVCSMQHKKAVEVIARLKGFSLKKAHYSMLCSSLSEASEYVRPMDKDTYQFLRGVLPGPYTFIMEANNSVPRYVQNANKSIGVRVPDNEVCKAVIEALGCPVIGTSVRVEDEDMEPEYLTDPELIHEMFGKMVDVVVDGGIGEDEPSTVVSVVDGDFEVIREGKGPLDI